MRLPELKKYFTLTNKDIINQIFKINTYYSHFSKVEKYPIKWFQQKFELGLIVYLIKNREVGAYAIATLYPEKPDCVCLCVMGVKKEDIGWGFGRQVIDRFIKKFPNKQITLNVNRKNDKAIKLYELVGFKRVKEDKDFYYYTKKGGTND